MSDPISIRPVPADIAFCEDDFPLLTASAELPQISGNHRFQRYYSACTAAFERWCRYRIFPQAQVLYRQALDTAAPIPQWHAALQTAITCHTDHLLSLYTETVLTGPPQRTVLRRADTWDLRNTLPLTAAEFFPPRTHWRALLLHEATRQIQQQQAQGIAAYDPQWSKKLRCHFRPQRFYLTPEGLCFFFPMNTIAPPAEGIPTFCLPYHEECGPFPPK